MDKVQKTIQNQNNQATVSNQKTARFAFARASEDNGSTDDFATIVALLRTLPKNNVPLAMRRRTYLEHLKKPQHWWSTLGNLNMLAGTLAILMIITLSAGTYWVAAGSLPGDTSYQLKRNMEQLRVKFATSPESKVELQLKLAEKRLDEAKLVLAQNPDNNEKTAAALTELANQTKSTLATVEAAAHEQAIPQKPEILETITTLTDGQLELTQSIAAKPDTTTLSEEALNTAKESTVAVANIKRLVAASKEELLTKVEDLPTIVSGIVTEITKTTVTVEKTTINVTEQTAVKTSKGDVGKLTANAKVSVNALNKEGKLTATEITIEVPVPQPTVLGDKDPVKKPVPPPPPAPAEVIEEVKESVIRGTFIPEDPAP